MKTTFGMTIWREITIELAMLVGTSAWAADVKPSSAPTVSLMQAVPFTDAKGQDVVVGSGQYPREVAGKSGLKLTPVGSKKPIVVEGHAGPVKIQAALSMPVNGKEHHLVLLLPKGKAIAGVGSPSGGTSCAVLLALVVPQQANAQLMR